MIGLLSSKIFNLTSLPTGGSLSRLTRALVSPIFSVIPSTRMSSPLSASLHLTSTGILAVMRLGIGVRYDDVEYSICAIIIPYFLELLSQDVSVFLRPTAFMRQQSKLILQKSQVFDFCFGWMLEKPD